MRLHGCALALLALAATARAEEPSAADDAEYAALLETLQQETEIATKTRMNRDFVPGMVSVLDADDLQALGVRTVWEALAQIPGVQTELDARGNPTVTARGVYFPFNSGSIQILLNGFPIGREDIGSNGAALFLPIAHVERLEFVRGPGSVLYGDFAFQGLLNILTRQDGRALNLGVDSHGERSAHWLHSGSSGDWHYSSSIAALLSDDVVLPQGRSASEQRRSGIFQLGNGALSLLAQGESRDIGNIVSNPPDGGYEDSAWTLAARYERALTDALELRVHTQYLNNRVYTGEARTPQGSASLVFEGSQVRSGADLSYSGWSGQQWLLGIEQLNGKIDLATFRAMPTGPGQTPPVIRIENERREVYSAYAQDQIEISAGLHLTLGARFDDNKDVGQRLTPRASVVWQPGERHVFKAQYAEGHRAPTFFELYTGASAQDLDFEVNKTVELSYIYRRPGQTLRATWYRARIADMVFLNTRARGFGNVGHARSQGTELEWSQQLGAAFKLDANVSFADAVDNRNLDLVTRPIGSTPDWMGQLGLQWRPAQTRTLGLTWNHIGHRAASRIGNGSYDRVDLSGLLAHWPHPDLDLRVGVDNLFDQRTVQILTAPNGASTLPYQDRIWWVELSWRY